MASSATIVQNIDPIYPHTPNQGWSKKDGDGGTNGPIKTANITKDGTVAPLNLIFTAGANGSILNKIVFKAAGENIATIARIFVNDGTTHTTPGSNVMRKEVPLPATVLNESTGNPDIEVPMHLWLKAGYRIYVTIGLTVLGGWWASAEGGDY